MPLRALVRAALGIAFDSLLDRLPRRGSGNGDGSPGTTTVVEGATLEGTVDGLACDLEEEGDLGRGETGVAESEYSSTLRVTTTDQRD